MNHNQHSIAILMATYNGQSFIEAQLESIAYQLPGNSSKGEEEANIGRGFLIASDDNSTDDTVAKIRDKCEALNLTCNITAPVQDCKGHRGNFAHLCVHALSNVSPFDYYAFSDQDDVWEPAKLHELMQACNMGAVASLVHCDLAVVSEKLTPIASSFVRFQGLPKPDSQPLADLLHQNVVTGCATLFNRAALELATPIPDASVLHDHWFALVSQYMGEVHFVDKPLVKYRQHGKNSIGATSAEKQRSFFSPYFYKMLLRFPAHLAQAVEQAKCLEQRRIDRGIVVSLDKRRVVLRFACIKELALRNRLRSYRLLFSGKRSFLEKTYLMFVLCILPGVKCRKSDITVNELLTRNIMTLDGVYNLSNQED